MYNLPQVSDDGKAIDVDPFEKKDFPEEEEAKKCAEDNKDRFDRVVVMKTEEGKQEMIDRHSTEPC